MVTATLEKPILREEDMKICHHCRIGQSLKKLNLWDAKLESLYNNENCVKQPK